jgi:hypothetical protein
MAPNDGRGVTRLISEYSAELAYDVLPPALVDLDASAF